MKILFETLGVIAVLGFFILLIVVVGGTCNTATKIVGNAQQTVYDQFKPSELLRKYMWFKDAGAQLDGKIATIQAYESKNSDIKSQYTGIPRNRWAKSDIDAYDENLDDEAGAKGSYNILAGQYNAAMKEFNYRFTNVGGLPEGLPDSLKGHTLQREYKEYISQ